MIHLVLKRWKQRKWLTLLIFLAFSAFFFLIPFNIQQVHNTELAVEQTLEKYGRGQFDILVRPAGSRTDIEKSTETIAENYIGDSEGGISIDEWEKIKKHPLVEIAAPVASIGYFNGKGMSIGLPEPTRQTLFSWYFTTSDGVQTYRLPMKNNLMYFGKVQEGMLVTLVDEDGLGMGGSSLLSIELPKNYYLLVGIDPESEEKLVGEEISSLLDKPISSNAELVLESSGAQLIKVLRREGLDIPLKLEVDVKPIDVRLTEVFAAAGINFGKDVDLFSPEHVDETMDALHSLYNKPKKKDQLMANWVADQTYEKTRHSIDFTSYLTPFDGKAYQLDDNYALGKAEGHATDQDTGIYYTADKIQYEEVDGKITVSKVNKEGIPEYKKVQQHGASWTTENILPFLIEQVGTFSYDEATTSSYVSSPLGIYSMQETFTKDGKQVTSTILPGSFVSPPASAVTDLASAALIKGDKPIDAIRVKVAGITKYNDAAKQRIDELSIDLLEQGYEVAIVAGSSFVQKTLDVEGIGEVTEPWTTLGVAQALEDSWNIAAIVLIGLFILFSLTWVATRSVFEAHIYEEEKQLLLTVGWSKRQVKRIRLLDQGLILLVASCVAIVLLFLFNMKIMYIGYASILGLVALIVCAISVMWDRKKSERQSYGERRQSRRYYRYILTPMTVMTTFSLIVLTLQLLLMVETFTTNNLTSLGEFITKQTGSLQIGIIVVTVSLTIYSLTESLEAIFKERKEELIMYRAIGWSRMQITRFYSHDLNYVFIVALVISAPVIVATTMMFSYSLVWALLTLVATVILFQVLIVGNIIRSMINL